MTSYTFKYGGFYWVNTLNVRAERVTPPTKFRYSDTPPPCFAWFPSPFRGGFFRFYQELLGETVIGSPERGAVTRSVTEGFPQSVGRGGGNV